MTSDPYQTNLESKEMIDQYAHFVARGGPRFEALTMSRQQNNIRFSFIHPSDPLHDYYQERVALEKQKLFNSPSSQPSFNQPPPECIDTQVPLILLRLITGVRNVNDPYFKLRVNQIESVIRERLNRQTVQLKIDRNTLECAFKKAMQHCTKENIAHARSEAVEILTDSDRANMLVCLFLYLVMLQHDDPTSLESSLNRLHAIYLLNDILSNCAKTYPMKLDLLQAEVEPTLPLLFASVAFKITRAGTPCPLEPTDHERCKKLIKLLELWKKNNYFSNCDNLQELSESIACISEMVGSNEYCESSNRLASYADSYIDKEFKPELDRLQAYSQFYSSQPPPPVFHQRFLSPPPFISPSHSIKRCLLVTPPTVPFNPAMPPPGFVPFPVRHPPVEVPVRVVPPSFMTSKRAFEQQYYDLPAGLMCMHVKSADKSYKSLDPKSIKPSSPPNENELVDITNALKEFDEACKTEEWDSSALEEICKARLVTERSLSNSSYSSSRSTSPESDDSVKRKFTSAPEVILDPMNINKPIDSRNKGHQLLQKMGWTGSGLGKKEQGITEPIKQSDTRDSGDKYRGVGVDSDVFDDFRKSRSQKYNKSWQDKR